MSKGKYIKDGRPRDLQSGWQPLRNPYSGAMKQKEDSSTIGADSVSKAMELLQGKVYLHVSITKTEVNIVSGAPAASRPLTKAERKSAERAARASEVRARDAQSMAKSAIADLLKGL